jgi:hypothetical protein
VLSKSGSAFIIQQPDQYTIPEVQANIIAIDEHIDSRRECAPELRQQHLRDRKSDAEAKGDSNKRANDILTIIRREHLSNRYGEVNKIKRVRKGGGSVFKVEKRELDGTTSTMTTQDAIEKVAGQTIGDCYGLAYSAPIMTNPILKMWVSVAMVMQLTAFSMLHMSSLLVLSSIPSFFSLKLPSSLHH